MQENYLQFELHTKEKEEKEERLQHTRYSKWIWESRIQPWPCLKHQLLDPTAHLVLSIPGNPTSPQHSNSSQALNVAKMLGY